VSARFLPGNQIELLHSGSEYFPALLTAIDAAATEIHLETYLFANDETGRSIAAALVRAVQRGVAVRILVDGFGAREFPHTFGAQLKTCGAEILVYRPEVAALRMRRHRLRRLHRKLVVIDAGIAFVGGINIIDDMDTPRQIPPRFDYAVRIEGPLLADIHAAVRHLWWLVSWADLRHRASLVSRLRPRVSVCGQMTAGFIVRDNLRHRRDIEEAYLEAIAGARREVLIANAYFLPGRRFRRAVMQAAKRGVSVTVILQGRVEYALLHYATRSLYGSLVASGVRIFEYRRSFLHAKVAVIDRQWATVGSSNIDPFSLLLSREANVVVRDEAFSQCLFDSLQRAMADGAVEVRAEDLRRRSVLGRVLSWLAYGMVRLMIGVTRYGGRDYRE